MIELDFFRTFPHRHRKLLEYFTKNHGLRRRARDRMSGEAMEELRTLLEASLLLAAALGRSE